MAAPPALDSLLIGELLDRDGWCWLWGASRRCGGWCGNRGRFGRRRYWGPGLVFWDFSSGRRGGCSSGSLDDLRVVLETWPSRYW